MYTVMCRLRVVIAQDDENRSFILRRLIKEYTGEGSQINYEKIEYLGTTEKL